jgi:hypothetical protein
MTHQSFRDDMMHLGAQHAGIAEGEMGETRLGAMTTTSARRGCAG